MTSINKWTKEKSDKHIQVRNYETFAYKPVIEKFIVIVTTLECSTGSSLNITPDNNYVYFR